VKGPKDQKAEALDYISETARLINASPRNRPKQIMAMLCIGLYNGVSTSPGPQSFFFFFSVIDSLEVRSQHGTNTNTQCSQRISKVMA
jgi:hypothetical protein